MIVMLRLLLPRLTLTSVTFTSRTASAKEINCTELFSKVEPAACEQSGVPSSEGFILLTHKLRLSCR